MSLIKVHYSWLFCSSVCVKIWRVFLMSIIRYNSGKGSNLKSINHFDFSAFALLYVRCCCSSCTTTAQRFHIRQCKLTEISFMKNWIPLYLHLTPETRDYLIILPEFSNFSQLDIPPYPFPPLAAYHLTSASQDENNSPRQGCMTDR